MDVQLLLSMGVIAVAAAFAVAHFRARRRAAAVAQVAQGDFLLAFSDLLAAVAAADGEVTADEVGVVEKFFAGMALSRSERAMCVGNFMLAQRERRDARAVARGLSAAFNRVALGLLHALLWRVADADGRVSPEEEALLRDVGDIFGITADCQAKLRRGSARAFDRLALEDAGVPPMLVRLFESC